MSLRKKLEQCQYHAIITTKYGNFEFIEAKPDLVTAVAGLIKPIIVIEKWGGREDGQIICHQKGRNPSKGIRIKDKITQNDRVKKIKLGKN